MRIAYLTTDYPKVSHTFIRRELLALESRGHEIQRLSIRRGQTFVDGADFEEAKRTFYCLQQSPIRMLVAFGCAAFLSPFRFLRALKTMWELAAVSDRSLLRHIAYLTEATILLRHLRSHAVEHVHVHFGTNAAAVALLLRTLGGPPYSMTVHGPDEFDAPIGGSLGKKVAGSLFTVAISSYCVSQIRRWINFEDWDKVHIVHCTVGSEFTEPAPLIPSESTTLTCVGRLTPQKGQIVLLEALALVRGRGVDAKVILVGDGELREVLEDQIRRLRLESAVEITGWVNESRVREALIASRAFVLPSFAEGLPVAIMEALALGRPVISTSIAGIPELVTDHECGWMVTPSDVESLADAMQEAIELPISSLSKMGLVGRERILRHFTDVGEAEKLDRLILRAHGQPASSPQPAAVAS
ncbi:MAG: colanic acid/amylovoran biosynthesis glycosyltransferase [Planctomycetota bacterium]|jgi:colanic acid/amylovoran biosynthesis glycosyltransferase